MNKVKDIAGDMSELRGRLYSYEDQRAKFELALGTVWLRCMIEHVDLGGTVLLTKGPGIKTKLCNGIVLYEQEEFPCVLILSQKPQRIPSLLWNELDQQFGDDNGEIFSVEVIELRNGVPVVRMLEGFPWKAIIIDAHLYEDIYNGEDFDSGEGNESNEDT